MRLIIKGAVALFLLLAISIPLSAQYIVQGVVTDSLTREPLSYVSVRLKNTTEGTTTGSDGRFYFKTHRSEGVLVISTVGYNEYSRLIHPARNLSYKVALSPATYALNEVLVKPKREHYRKKDNPAVEFVRRMIEHRDDHSPNEKDFWQRDRYEKTTFALNNFDEEKQKKWLYRKFDFLTEYVDTSAVTGKPILTVSARELLATDYYRKSPHSEKQWVKGRKQADDITYVTNNELGFDYLRDNMAIYKEQLVLRDLHYCIIDEVDSVLIDEARTPLIISGQSGKSTKLYELCDVLARQLVKGTYHGERTKMQVMMQEEIEEDGDFIVNEKDKVVNLTEQGVHKVEQFFHIDNYADIENLEIQHNVTLALRAHYLMFRDKDYVVKDDEVLIVDEFTGRIMPGRRYSDGLHQAIEAKEHVKVKRESKTLATITFQNFFNKFDKKAGMTGTALTEEKEFRGIYNMDVVEVPTNKPIARIDHNDAVFKTMKGKFNAVVEEVVAAHEKGQPVLVGTITIDTSELLSEMLRKRGIPHNVLNAKYHELEAQIVADAGKHGAVTIATNMAGRGTDIKLDEEARAAGGLKIIGTERHESRRIDNQLRGRAGRQGDPGESRFYISLEDNLMRLFAQETLMNTFNRLGVGENDQIEHKLLSNAIETAQKKIETNNYGIRLHLLEYDQVMNEQREIMYAERKRVLNGESMRNSIMKMITDFVEGVVNRSVSEDKSADEWNYDEINELLLPTIPIAPVVYDENIKNKNELIHTLKEKAVKFYEDKEALFPEPETIREIERVVLLKVIDRKWMDHIDDMDQLKQGIGLQAYGQKDPVVQYKMMGYDMFDEMTRAITEDTVRLLMHIQVEEKVEREQVAKVTGTNKDEGPSVKGPVRRTDKKIYPNDLCPCGSGKKYKNCCGRQA